MLCYIRFESHRIAAIEDETSCERDANTQSNTIQYNVCMCMYVRFDGMNVKDYNGLYSFWYRHNFDMYSMCLCMYICIYVIMYVIMYACTYVLSMYVISVCIYVCYVYICIYTYLLYYVYWKNIMSMYICM